MIDDASGVEAGFQLLVERLTEQIALCADDPTNACQLETLRAARAKAVHGIKLVQSYRCQHSNAVKSDT